MVNNKRNLTMKPVSTSKVRQMIRSSRDAVAELKSYDVNIVSNAVILAGTMWSLSQGITQGDSNEQRSGLQVYVKSVTLHLRAQAPISSGTVRFILFQDKMCNGVVPTVLEVLSAAQFQSDYQQAFIVQEKRFKILHDVVIEPSATGQQIISKSFTTRKLLHVINYLGATDVNASNGRNSIYMVAIGSNVANLYDWNWQMRYIDQ